MAFTVKIFTKQAGRPTLYQTREFDTLPVTIGRDATCTLALEDPLKHISRVHVELEEEEGTYWMSVVSKVNPVMVKGRRYGPGTRLTLNSGDSFEMGEFEVQVFLPEKPRSGESAEAEKKSLIGMFAEDESAAQAAAMTAVAASADNRPLLSRALVQVLKSLADGPGSTDAVAVEAFSEVNSVRE